jgi:hypothetical protein
MNAAPAALVLAADASWVRQERAYVLPDCLVSQVGPGNACCRRRLVRRTDLPRKLGRQMPIRRVLYFCANILPATRVNGMYDALTALTITRKK